MEHKKQAEIPEVSLPLIKYFWECQRSTSYAGLIVSLDYYLENQFGNNGEKDISIDNVVGQGLIIDETMYDFSERQGKEQFLLVPLRLAPQLVELSSMSYIDINNWYESAAGIALSSGHQTLHDTNCLTVQNKLSKGCKHSINCPLKATRSLLLDDIINPDFSSPEYIVLEDLMHELVRIKIHVAIMAGVLTVPEADTYIYQYNKLMEEFNTAEK